MKHRMKAANAFPLGEDYSKAASSGRGRVLAQTCSCDLKAQPWGHVLPTAMPGPRWGVEWEGASEVLDSDPRGWRLCL